MPPNQPPKRPIRPIVAGEPVTDQEAAGLTSDDAPLDHDPARLYADVGKLPADWVKPKGLMSLNRHVRPPTYTNPTDVYIQSDATILVRRRHNMHICAICGMRLGDFAAICGLSPYTLNTLLTRKSVASSATLQAVVDGINMIKGERAVNMEWVIKYFRHDISDLTVDEIKGTFSWQEVAYSVKVSHQRAIRMVHGMQKMIRQNVRNRRMREIGVVPAAAVQRFKSPEEFAAEVRAAEQAAAEESRREHFEKIKGNKVQLLGHLLRQYRVDEVPVAATEEPGSEDQDPSGNENS